MRTILITGGNAGLGFEAARKIAAEREHRVILACRDPERAAAAQSAIRDETGNPNVETMLLDTSLLSSVRSFAEQYIRQFGTLDALLNNAGISVNHKGTTAEGFELIFATNYLGHFLLTQLLLPHMTADGRIVSVSSDMHDPPGGLVWKGAEHLAHPAEDDRSKYSYSKLCLLYFTYKLDELLRQRGSRITVNAFNPGFMTTTRFFAGQMDEAKLRALRKTIPERCGELGTSSDALAALATEARLAGVSGRYFDRSTKAVPSSALSRETEPREELWQASLAYCGLDAFLPA